MIAKNKTPYGRRFTVVVVYRRAISHNIFVGVYVCFCNLRCLVQYLALAKSASEITKITTLSSTFLVGYTSSMSIFVSATKAPHFKTKNIQAISLFLAAILAIMALLQLFTFEQYPERLISVGILPSMAPLLATFIVVAEVLALPFVLRLRLSPAFRVVSMVAGWLVGLKLLALAIIENFIAAGGNDAVFGATLSLPVGGWTICMALALCVLVGWTSWGMWPFSSRK